MPITSTMEASIQQFVSCSTKPSFQPESGRNHRFRALGPAKRASKVLRRTRAGSLTETLESRTRIRIMGRCSFGYGPSGKCRKE